ncbi:MAG: hypothetical protein QNK68_07410 [Flavobacteriales bacterium]
MVLISFLSYFKSLISKGIVIASTNKNRSSKSGIRLKERVVLLSVTTSIVVVNVQTIAIKNIFKKGTSLKEILENDFKGYKKEIRNNGIKKYKLIGFRLKIKAKQITIEIKQIMRLNLKFNLFQFKLLDEYSL